MKKYIMNKYNNTELANMIIWNKYIQKYTTSRCNNIKPINIRIYSQ